MFASGIIMNNETKGKSSSLLSSQYNSPRLRSVYYIYIYIYINLDENTHPRTKTEWTKVIHR